MQIRLYSVEEANALLPTLETLFQRVQAAIAELREARDHLVDLRIVWGDRVEDAACEGHGEYVTYRTRFAKAEAAMQEGLARFNQLGCEVKDVEQGLVDFHARRGDEVVFLCWKRGEPEVTAWHTHMAGYSGRRPLTEF